MLRLTCRLLGSHGQNLAEMAENMPPAMAVQEPRGSGLGLGFPRGSGGTPTWGAVDEGRSPPQRDRGRPFADIGAQNGGYGTRFHLACLLCANIFQAV